MICFVFKCHNSSYNINKDALGGTGYWASVRSYSPASLCYDTDYFKQVEETEQEAKMFCKWKKLKIRKIIREYKK